MLKNTSGQFVCAQLVSATDGTAVTSGTTTVYYLIDGGTQGTGSGTVTHEGNGTWSYAPTQAETNGDHVAFTFANSSAVSTCVNTYPVSFDYTDSVRIGLTSLPNAAADAAGGLPISDAGGLDLDATVGAMVYTVANQLDVNVLGVSGSTSAADNVELVFDSVTGDFGDAYDTTSNRWNVAVTGTPDVNVVQISGSGVAAINAEIVFDTDFATNYNTTLDKWATAGDVVSVSGSTTAADNLEIVFDTDFATAYSTSTNKFQTEADMIKISGNATSADNLEESTLGIVPFTCDGGTQTTTVISTTLAEGTADHYIGRTIVFNRNSSMAGQASIITDYASGDLTVETMTEAASSGDTGVII